jgi:tetratricopeptide (TPR) repeat protein
MKIKQNIAFALLLFFSALGSCLAFRLLNASSVAFHSGEAMMSQGNLAEALKSFRIAADAGGLRPSMALKLAHAAFLAGDAAISKDVLTSLIASKAKLSPDVLNAVAGEFDTMGLPTMALAVLRRAGDSVFRSEPAATYLANLHVRADNHDEAEQLYRRVLELYPDSMAATLGLAQLLAWQKRTQEAEALCEPLLLRNPDNRQARIVLGRVLTAAKRFDDAIVQYRLALKEAQ